MALRSIPVWTIPPDWANIVNEYLEWKTGVLASVTGAEQRMALRLSPRRAIETVVTVLGPWRTYYDALLSTPDQVDFYTPLWHDRAVLSRLALSADPVILVEGVRTEMAFATALFVAGPTPWQYELLEVTSVAFVGGRTEFTVVDGLANDWPKGTPVYAAVVGTLTAQPQTTRSSDSALHSTVRFDLVQANDWTPTLDLPAYRGFPVVELETNEDDTQTGSYFRYSAMLDNQVGIPVRRDLGGVGFPAVGGSNFVYGRSKADDLRTLLYALRGKCARAWFSCPTTDFTVARPALAADVNLVVARSGFADLTGPVEGRQDIRIRMRNGTVLYRRITSAVVNADDVTDTLVLDSALGTDVAPKQVARISFLAPGRLDQDLVTLTHTTDTEGVCGVTLAFKTVPDLRDAEDWFPIEPLLSAMGDCGPAFSGQLWVRVNDGPWNMDPTANPSFGFGGIDISAIPGPYFPMGGINVSYDLAWTPWLTLNFGASAFKQSVPHRANAWGSGTVLNSADANGTLAFNDSDLQIGRELFSGTAGPGQAGLMVRATTSTATQTGLRYFEAYTDTSRPPSGWFVGAGNASASLGGFFVGGGVADDAANSRLFDSGILGTHYLPSLVILPGDTVCVCIFT